MLMSLDVCQSPRMLKNYVAANFTWNSWAAMLFLHGSAAVQTAGAEEASLELTQKENRICTATKAFP